MRLSDRGIAWASASDDLLKEEIEKARKYHFGPLEIRVEDEIKEWKEKAIYGHRGYEPWFQKIHGNSFMGIRTNEAIRICHGCNKEPAEINDLCKACDADLAAHYDAQAQKEREGKEAEAIMIDEQVRKAGVS